MVYKCSVSTIIKIQSIYIRQDVFTVVCLACLDLPSNTLLYTFFLLRQKLIQPNQSSKNHFFGFISLFLVDFLTSWNIIQTVTIVPLRIFLQAAFWSTTFHFNNCRLPFKLKALLSPNETFINRINGEGWGLIFIYNIAAYALAVKSVVNYYSC